MPNWDRLTFDLPDLQTQQQVQLSPEEELVFQKWITQLPWYEQFKLKYGEPPNLNDPMYDYRAAWKAGVTPQINPSDNMYHWSDFAGNKMLKSPNHPTAWMEYFMNQFGGLNPDTLSEFDPRVLAYKRAWQNKYPPR
jgi:hypothetical protein